MNDTNPIPGGLVGPIQPTPAAVELIGASGTRSIAPVPATSASGGPTAGASPLSLLRALRRRLALALSLALVLSAVCSTAAWFLLPEPKFRAFSRVQVMARAPNVALRGPDVSGEDTDYRRYQKTQQQVIKSRAVIELALQRPEATQIKKYGMLADKKDKVEWLIDNLLAQFVQDSEILEISLSGDNPVEITQLVNLVTETYTEFVTGRDTGERSSRHAKLRGLTETYSNLLKEKRKEERKLAEDAGSGDRETLALRQQYAAATRMSVQQELLDVQRQKRHIDAIIKVQRPEGLQETSAPANWAKEVAALIEQHPEVAGLKERLADLQGRYDSAMAHTGRVSRKKGMDPGLNDLRNEVESLKKLLLKKRETVRPFALRQLQEPRQDGTPRRELSLTEQLQILDVREKALNEQLDGMAVADTNLNANTLDLKDIQDEVKTFQELYDKYNRDAEMLNVELNAQPRVRKQDNAVVPTSRDTKKWYMMFGMASVGSFLLPLLGVAFLELRTRKVDSVDEVVMNLGLPVVGSLPILPARARQGGSARTTEKDRYWYNLLLESIDATRTMLIHAARNGSHRVVMITSALSGEGKTSLASHLATSLARSGHRTLLIDADLRKPSIHHLFELTNEPGMSELLRGEAEIDDVIASTAIEELKVITAGQCDHQTLRILSQGGMGSHFAAFKENFDFVIVDSSPVLPVADASIIAQQVDAALFSVLTDVSRKDKIQAAYQRLAHLGVKILGAVVTGAHDGSYGKNYYPGSVYGAPQLSDSLPGEAEAAS